MIGLPAIYDFISIVLLVSSLVIIVTFVRSALRCVYGDIGGSSVTSIPPPVIVSPINTHLVYFLGREIPYCRCFNLYRVYRRSSAWRLSGRPSFGDTVCVRL